MVTLDMFVIYFLIKVEITLLNNVNLTDCFTSTLRLVDTALRDADQHICVVLLDQCVTPVAFGWCLFSPADNPL